MIEYVKKGKILIINKDIDCKIENIIQTLYWNRIAVYEQEKCQIMQIDIGR